MISTSAISGYYLVFGRKGAPRRGYLGHLVCSAPRMMAPMPTICGLGGHLLVTVAPIAYMAGPYLKCVYYQHTEHPSALHAAHQAPRMATQYLTFLDGGVPHMPIPSIRRPTHTSPPPYPPKRHTRHPSCLPNMPFRQQKWGRTRRSGVNGQNGSRQVDLPNPPNLPKNEKKKTAKTTILTLFTVL